MTGALASHYACALADAILAPDSDLKPPQALDQLRSIQCVLSSSEQLQLVLIAPSISKEEKLNLAKQLAAALELHGTIRNFLLLVVLHGRTREFGKMAAEFEKAVDARQGIVPAQVSSARELSDMERETLQSALSRKLGKPVKASYQVDPSLLGGIKVIVASKEYDTSLRGRLGRLHTQLFADA